MTEEEIIEHYAKNKVEVVQVYKPNRDAADLEFKTKEELIKAVDLGDFSLKGRTVFTRSSFKGQSGAPRGRGYGRGRGGDRGGRGGRSERFGSEHYNDSDRGNSPKEDTYQRAGNDFQRGGYGSGFRSRGGGFGGGFGGGYGNREDRPPRRDDQGPRDWDNKDRDGGYRGTGVFRSRGGTLVLNQAEEATHSVVGTACEKPRATTTSSTMTAEVVAEEATVEEVGIVATATEIVSIEAEAEEVVPDSAYLFVLL